MKGTALTFERESHDSLSLEGLQVLTFANFDWALKENMRVEPRRLKIQLETSS